MTLADHENYASDLLASLAAGKPDSDSADFVPAATRSRNAANAMTAFVCSRLLARLKRC